MDIDPLTLVRKVWQHSGVQGYVWAPHIYKIGHKTDEKFREGAPLRPRKPALPELRDSVDWYWTPAVSRTDSRKAKKYGPQKAIWVDCDEGYDNARLEALRPSYMWETSPGHKQAVWLLDDPLPASEYKKDGFIGLLTQAIGADPSGVDIGQLLRFPGTWHHKREPFQGSVLRATGQVYKRGVLLSRVARVLGFTPQLASEIGADDPFGDRSKLLWKFERTCAELGMDKKLAFALVKACSWNKWRDDPEKLWADIERAYGAEPAKETAPAAERLQAIEHAEERDDDAPVQAWGLARVESFGRVIRRPVAWLVPGIIPEASVGFLIAPPKTSKSRIAAEMSLGIATGRRPLGLSVSRPKPVGYLSYEDGEYLFADRLSKSLNHVSGRQKYHWDGHIQRAGKSFTWHPPEPLNLFTSFEQSDLTEPRDMQALYETIDAYGLKFMVIDTLSMAIGKANVSDQKEMNSILPNVRTIARETGCAIMFIHHTRKRQFEQGESIQESILGATALHAWAEFTISMARPVEEGDPLRMGVQTKMGESKQFLINATTLQIIKTPTPEEISE